MKTKLFVSLIVGLFVSINVFSGDPVTPALSNIEITATGSIKEVTTFKANSSEPLQKSTYRYDLSGNIQEKTVYNWAGKKGWVGNQKLEYTYEESNSDKPVSLTFTKWDNKISDWSTNSQKVTYTHDADGSTSIDLKTK